MLKLLCAHILDVLNGKLHPNHAEGINLYGLQQSQQAMCT